MHKKTLLITFLLNVVAIQCYAQSFTVESQIIDAVTKEPLTGASIYTENGTTGEKRGTISNTEGTVSFSVPSKDASVKVAYLGYASKVFKAENIPAQILLTPIAYDIKPALVIDKEEFIGKLYEKCRSLADKSNCRRDLFFYRQTTLTNKKYTEILEAIFNAESEFDLDNLSIVHGRYAKVTGDTIFTFKNFFYYSQIRFLQGRKAKKRQVLAPLNPETFKYYDISVDLMFDNKNNDIYVIHFMPKPDIDRIAIKGDLYVDPASMAVLRYVVDTPLPIEIHSTKEKICPLTHLILDFDNVADVPVIRSIVASLSFSFSMNKKTISAKVSSLMVKTDENIVMSDEKKISKNSVLIREVSGMKDDPEFWRSNQIIKRTPLEEDALAFFEKQNLVGNYTISQ